MSAAKGKPTFIFVNGAWHTPAIWSSVTNLLHAQNYHTLTPSLPSTCGRSDVTISEDIAVTRDAILSETKEGRDVVLVVWSAGGIIGATALAGLARPKPTSESETEEGQGEIGEGKSKEEGKRGYVIGMAMIATGFAQEGQTLLSGSGGVPPPFWRVSDDGFAEFVPGTTDEILRSLFYHDLPVAEGEKWVKQLTPQAIGPLRDGGEFVKAGWKEVPCWFLATTEDRAFPVEVQRLLVKGAQGEGGYVVCREVRSGHCPMVSCVAETVGFLLDAERAFVAADAARR